jgi:hypothetical protein
MDLGIVGAAIYGAISMDQHSKRSHPNKAADVVFAKASEIKSWVLSPSTPVCSN